MTKNRSFHLEKRFSLCCQSTPFIKVVELFVVNGGGNGSGF